MSVATVAPDVLPRRLRAVCAEPPFAVDDALDGDDTPIHHGGACPGAAPLLPWPPPRPLTALPPLPETDEARRARERVLAAELRSLFGARRTGRAELPSPGPLAAVAVRALLEVLAGDRPARQLSGWVSPTLLTRLEQRVGNARRGRPWAATVRSVHVTEPADGVAEVAAVITGGTGVAGQPGGRCRALALRLEGVDGRWNVTALHLG